MTAAASTVETATVLVLNQNIEMLELGWLTELVGARCTGLAEQHNQNNGA